MQNNYSEQKAAQSAAFFLFKARGRLPVLKLMKLLYLAERLSYKKYGEPLIGDKLVSMEHGPVLSRTLNRINGMSISEQVGWDTWICPREGYDVALKDSSTIRSPEEDLLELSDADILVLNEIWEQFGHYDKYQLRDFTHDQCREWKDPEGSSYPIEFDTLFKALEFNDKQTESLKSRLEDRDILNAAFKPE